MIETLLLARAPTPDNERRVAVGQNDVDLSDAGVRLAHARARECADSPPTLGHPAARYGTGG